MRSFYHALRDSLRHWPSLLLATILSIVVAALWSANIGACYPILEIALHNKSIDDWIASKETASQTEIANIQEELQGLRASETVERAILNQRLESETASISRLQWLRKHANRWVPQDPFDCIALILGLVIASTLLKHMLMMGTDLLVARVAISISQRIRQRLFDRALDLDRATFMKIGSSTFSTHILGTSEMLTQGLMGVFGGAVREPLRIVACLVGAAIICPRLLVVSLITAPIFFTLFWWLTRKVRSLSHSVLNKVAGFHRVMLGALGHLNTTQAYNMESYESARFAESMNDLRRFSLKRLLYTSLTRPVSELLGLGLLGTAILTGAFLVLHQETHLLGMRISDEPLTVSALLIFFGMLVGATDPLRKFAAVHSGISAGIAAAESLHSALYAENQVTDPETPRVAPTPHGKIELHDVTFSYLPEQTILKNVSFEIPFGSTIAVVGRNGTGKSTLTNLLCRFADPVSGALTMDGVDFREMTRESIRRRIAIVTQHTELLEGSVADNIRYGSPEATDAEVEAAARQAHAHEFIVNRLEDGYRTKVGHNGCRLSGGERQRVALARALLRNPEILILDECTSQIDMESERLIRSSLEADRGRCTMVIITHREALLKLADCVYELRDGGLQPAGYKQPQVA